MAKQTIIIQIETGEYSPYDLFEKRPGRPPYPALVHFFEDLGHSVQRISFDGKEVWPCEEAEDEKAG